MGLGFTAVGVALSVYIAVFVQFDPWIIAFLLVLFSVVGFGPLLLSVIPARGWRTTVELRLDDRGIWLVDSAGHARGIGWDDPAAVVTVREMVRTGPTGQPPERGEWLVLLPGLRTAHIGPEAREGLLAACRAHGFVLGEDRFDVPDPADRGRSTAEAVLRMAARPPPGGAFGPSPPSTSGRLPADSPPLQAGARTFTAPTEQQSYDRPQTGVEPNPIQEVTVTSEGVGVTLRDGRTLSVGWHASKLRLELFAILPSPVATLSDAPSWRLSIRQPPCRGSVSADAYAELRRSAKSAGLRVTTFRFPRPNRGTVGTGAITTIQTPSSR